MFQGNQEIKKYEEKITIAGYIRTWDVITPGPPANKTKYSKSDF